MQVEYPDISIVSGIDKLTISIGKPDDTMYAGTAVKWRSEDGEEDTMDAGADDTFIIDVIGGLTYYFSVQGYNVNGFVSEWSPEVEGIATSGHQVSAREGTPLDIDGFFMLCFRLMTSLRPDIVFTESEPVDLFGQEDDFEELSLAELTQYRSLKAKLLTGELTDAELSAYTSLCQRHERLNKPYIIFTLDSRTPGGGIKPSGKRQQIKGMRKRSYPSEQAGMATVDRIWTYDNIVDFTVVSLSKREADELILWLQYTLEDYIPWFQSNGIDDCHMVRRIRDELEFGNKIFVHQRHLYWFVRTYRVSSQQIRAIEEIVINNGIRE